MNHHIILKTGRLFFIIFLQSLFGIDYGAHIQPVFNQNCTICHGESGGLSLTSYNDVMNGGNSGDVVIPYNQANSLLLQKVYSGAMPPGNNPDLTDAIVDLIGSWIVAGALENTVEDIDLILVDGNVFIGDSLNVYNSGVMIIFNKYLQPTLFDTVYSYQDGSFYHLADTGSYNIEYQLDSYYSVIDTVLIFIEESDDIFHLDDVVLENCLDACGNCGGNCAADENNFVTCGESENNVIKADCNGVCDGGAELDECDVCDGDGTEPGYDCAGNCIVELDCADACGGDAFIDCNGVCAGDWFTDCSDECIGSWNWQFLGDGWCNDGIGEEADLTCFGFENGFIIGSPENPATNGCDAGDCLQGLDEDAACYCIEEVDCAGVCDGFSQIDDYGECCHSEVIDDCGKCFGFGVYNPSTGECEYDEIITVEGHMFLEGTNDYGNVAIIFERYSPTIESKTIYSDSVGYFSGLFVAGIYNIHFEKYDWKPMILHEQFLLQDIDMETITMELGYAEDVFGEVSGVWTNINDYYVTADIIVPADSTLTIEAGVNVLFTGFYNFTVEGTIIAEGTENDSIFFTSNQPVPDQSDWGSIKLHSVSNILRYVQYEYADNGITGKDDISGSIFENCTITEIPQWPEGTGEGRWNCHGIMVGHSNDDYNCDNCIFNHNVIDADLYHGIMINGSAKNVQITGNTINIYGMGIHIVGDPDSSTISFNTITLEQDSYFGIEVNNCYNCVFEGNTILSPNGGGLQSNNSYNVKIINNMIEAEGGTAIYAASSDSAKIMDNNIIADSDGIYANSSNNAQILGNTIIANTDGVNIDYASGSKIADNDIRGTTSEAIRFKNAENVVIENNFINPYHGYAIYNYYDYGYSCPTDSTTSFCFASHNNQIIDNHIEYQSSNSSRIIEAYFTTVKENYIRSSQSSNTIYGWGNDITENEIYSYSTSSNNVIHSYHQAYNSVIEENYIEYSGSGSAIYGMNLHISNNHIVGHNSNSYAIKINGPDEISIISNNNITTSGNGLWISGGGFDIDYNVIDCDGLGIDILNHSLLLIKNNTMVGNGDNLAIMMNENSDISIKNNIISNFGTGINTQSAIQEIQNNAFWENEYDVADGLDSLLIPPNFEVWECPTCPTNGNGDKCDPHSNIFLDPLFFSTSVIFLDNLLNEDYHIPQNSPCVDAGHWMYTDANGSISDIGAYPAIWLNAYSDAPGEITLEWQTSFSDNLEYYDLDYRQLGADDWSQMFDFFVGEEFQELTYTATNLVDGLFYEVMISEAMVNGDKNTVGTAIVMVGVPEIVVTPESVFIDLPQGDSDSLLTINILNEGGQDLDWSLNFTDNNLWLLGSVSFTKENYADYNNPANWDCITENVCITRQDNRPVYNPLLQSSYYDGGEYNDQTAGVEWAWGSTEEVLANGSVGTNGYGYTTDTGYWQRHCYGSGWTQTYNCLSNDNVSSMHLIEEDIYLDVTWHSWQSGGQGGGFSYTRAMVGVWLEIVSEETSGVLEMGESVDISFSVFSHGMETGEYQINLSVNNNDSDLIVPVILTVNPAGDIQIADSLEFGEWPIGNSLTQVIEIHNIGDDSLNITEISLSSNHFTVSDSIFTVEPGGVYNLDVTFNPDTLNSLISPLSIFSNDPDTPEATIILSGIGMIPQDLHITLSEFSDTLQAGEMLVKELILHNVGSYDLQWDITLIDTSFLSNSYLLSITPLNGILAGNFSDTLSVSFDATSLFYTEDYFADIIVSSNDPNDPSITIPYSLHIIGVIPPIMNVDISSIYAVIDKGTIDSSHQIIISNSGAGDLDWSLDNTGDDLGLKTFTKENYADYNDPANWDCITENVCITRQDNRPVYNPLLQSSYYGGGEYNVQTAGVEWAWGSTEEVLANGSVGTNGYGYTTDTGYWQRHCYGSGWTQTYNCLSNDNVSSMHLIEEDIYIDVTWHSWQSGSQGGGFSYTREANWLDISQSSGVVVSGASDTLQVIFDGLLMGFYSAEIIFRNNYNQAMHAVDLALVVKTSNNPGTVSYFNPVTPTGSFYDVYISEAMLDGVKFDVGDEIAIKDDELIVGASIYMGELPLAVRTYGKTYTTTGFSIGNEMSFAFYDFTTTHEASSTTSNFHFGDGTFGDEPFSVVSLDATVYHQRWVYIQGGKVELISLNVFPFDPNAESVFSSLDSLEIVYTDMGFIYLPEYNFNTISPVDITQGFHVFSPTDDTLLYFGLPQDLSNWPIIIEPNRWNSIGYLLNDAVDVTVILEDIVDAVEIIQDDGGGHYIPDQINTLGNMQPGAGYQVFLSTEEPETLYYNTDDVLSRQLADNIRTYRQSEYFSFTTTGFPYVVAIDQVDLDNGKIQLKEGNEIALFDGELCVGATAFDGEFPISVIAWKTYPDAGLPGFQHGNPIRAVVYLKESDIEVEMKLQSLEGYPDTFGGGPYAFVSLSGTSGLVPNSYALGQNYPNPFNPVTRINYQLPYSSDVRISIFNILGQEVATLVNSYQGFGYYQISWNGKNSKGKQVSAGVYFYRLQAKGDSGTQFTQTHKMLLLK